MAKSVEEATDLLQALKIQQRKKPITFFPLPHVDIPEHRVVARLIADGAIGEATSVECHRGHRGPDPCGLVLQKGTRGWRCAVRSRHLSSQRRSLVVRPCPDRHRRSATATSTRGPMDDGTVVRPDVEDSAPVSLWLDNRMAVAINANWNGSVHPSRHPPARHRHRPRGEPAFRCGGWWHLRPPAGWRLRCYSENLRRDDIRRIPEPQSRT